MMSIRREKIAQFIQQNDVVSFHEISALFPNVSTMTIHRDLNYLEQENIIERVRGGAKFSGHNKFEPDFVTRETVNNEAKEIIAKKAAAFFQSGGSVFIDSGTTTMMLAKQMPECNINVTTTGPNIATALSKKAGVSVTMCGGNLNAVNLSVSGPNAVKMLSKINIDTAFIVTSGFSLKNGFTCGRESEADIKSMAMEKASRVIMLMDSSKLNRLMPFTFGSLQDIDYLITDGKLPVEIQNAVTQAGVEVL